MSHTFISYLAWQTTAGIFMIPVVAYRILMFIKAGIFSLFKTTNPIIFPLYSETHPYTTISATLFWPEQKLSQPLFFFFREPH